MIKNQMTEFVVVAILVALAGVGLVVLTLNDAGDSPAARALELSLSAGLGALLALAYASRGLRRGS